MADDNHKLLLSLVQKSTNDLADIKADMRALKSDVAHHVRRTDVAEERLDAFEAELRPLRAHVVAFSTAGKLIGVTGTLVGIVLGLLKLYGG